MFTKRILHGRCLRRASEPPEDFLATDDRRFFANLDGSKDSHVLQALTHGMAKHILAFGQNFGHGGFSEPFKSAFYDGSHEWNLRE